MMASNTPDITDELMHHFISSDEEFDGFNDEDIENAVIRKNVSDVRDESDVDISDISSDDSDESSFHEDELQWSDATNKVDVFPFLENSGPTNDLDVEAEPISYFRLLMQPDFLEHVVSETNKYAVFLNADSTWKPLSICELEIFLGVTVIMGLNDLPELTNYWSTDDAIVNSFVLYKKKRQQFQKSYLPLYKYRLLLGKQLCASRVLKRVAPQKRKIERVVTEGALLGHILEKMPGRKRVCIQCKLDEKKANKGGSVQSTFGCKLCNVNLCKTGCHMKYHANSLL